MPEGPQPVELPAMAAQLLPIILTPYAVPELNLLKTASISSL
jgi:hypothetical protein